MSSSTPANQSDSAEASTSYKTRLPDKKTFIATLSGTAFVVGVTGATIYGLRKARLQALKEAQELAQAQTSSAAVPQTLTAVGASISAVPNALRRPKAEVEAVQSAEGGEGSASKGAFALFRQMNGAILNPRSASLKGVANQAPTSVFDDDTGALPSVLRRRRPPPPSDSSHTTSPSQTAASGTLSHPNDKIDYSEMDSTLDFLGLSTPVPLEEQRRLSALEQQASSSSGSVTFSQSAVGLSLKAFLIATGIVTFSTLAVVEVTKRTLGVETMDEFVMAMTKVVPSRKTGEAGLQGVAPHMRVARDESGEVQAKGEVGQPKSVDEALTDLSNAGSFEEWISTLRNQLDSERDFEVRQRFGNNATASNDSVSPSRTYPIPSVLENTEANTSFLRSVLSISPVLPTTAFSVGLVSGLLTSGKRAGLVFMAENAHRLPDTVQGWYFYSKTKNYKVLLGAAKGGLKQGLRLGVWTTGFCLAERVAELGRAAVQGERESGGMVGHWLDGALAGVGTAGVATLWNRLPRAVAFRVFQLGLLAGGGTGAIRDLQERLVHREIGGVASHT